MKYKFYQKKHYTKQTLIGCILFHCSIFLSQRLVQCITLSWLVIHCHAPSVHIITIPSAEAVITTRKRSLRRLYFYRCVSVHRGAYVGGVCMAGGVHGGGHVWQGMHGRGHAWQGACVAGGMHGTGACVVRGACMVGGMHGAEEGHAWCGKYYGIQSMSGQYAPYWNAFLLSE